MATKNFKNDINVEGSVIVENNLQLPAETATRALQLDASGNVEASNVTNTELGYLSGVTAPIQTQIDAADTAAADAQADIDAHIADAVDAHDASAISNIPSGNLAATNVQSALNELQSDINTRALDADVIKKDGSVAFTADQSMGGFKLTQLAAPTSASDAATKGYVDSALEGLRPKEAVRVATTANITLSGLQTIDGISLSAGQRVLVKDQTSAPQNGIYVVASGAWSRSTDFDSLSPIDEINKAYVAVQEGTANAGKLYVQFGQVNTLGVDNINFTFFNSVSGLIGGDGITVSGNNISIDHDGEGLTFVATQLSLELNGTTLAKSSAGLRLNDTAVTPNTYGSANETITITVDQQGRITSASEQIINITSSQVNDFNEAAQDAVGTILVDSASIDLSYNDATPSITASVIPGGVDHDALLNFVANEHVDHSTVEIQTGANSGLAGGGNITATRSLVVDINGTIALGAAPDNADEIMVYDVSGLARRKVTVAELLSNVQTGSAGDIEETSFSLANNQASPANVTGFLLGTNVRSFKALVSVEIDATSDLFESFELLGIQRGIDWQMSVESVGDNSQVNFTILASGQVQYTSGNIAGFVAGTIRFRAITTNF